ncbi:methionyl-tRNA formyltransferase [Endozoicomonas montiporae]|uniref:Methionyl-tRNA formyltransferase n=2 Tax=Endozoicomonas montiporae TaxID=1027273 RepID=A0A081N5Y1_9GAMM|nr:formyltransferase family protein [Endozoicomonas montiporae]AMO57237.1 methionyl-tRNA formyltransferase [Endozoicomonas montiporae CL-33]KEQ13854.1 methionyl-tRNA formyltransferase [Endozoicomonas montiporae]
MPAKPPEKKIKLALFASSCIAIPVINELLQAGRLAGVIVSTRQDHDARQLSSQLQQAGIPFHVFPESNPDQLLPIMDDWQADTGLVYTFPHRLPKNIIHAFCQGTFNLYASPLPKYRGAMPLYWQIRNRETESCLSIIRMEQTVDTGDIMFQQPLPLTDRDTLNTLANTMSARAPAFVTQFLDQLCNAKLHPRPQEGESTAAPMPQLEDLLVDWKSMTAEGIAAMARAGNPQFNGAVIKWQNAQIALMQATPVDHPGYGVEAGTVLHVGEPEGLIVATSDGALRLDVIMVTEGIFSGLAFAERFKLDAGMQFS